MEGILWPDPLTWAEWKHFLAQMKEHVVCVGCILGFFSALILFVFKKASYLDAFSWISLNACSYLRDMPIEKSRFTWIPENSRTQTAFRMSSACLGVHGPHRKETKGNQSITPWVCNPMNTCHRDMTKVLLCQVLFIWDTDCMLMRTFKYFRSPIRSGRNNLWVIISFEYSRTEIA